jgi:streptogramin lyase
MLPTKKSAISHPLTLWLILIALPFALTGCSASFNSTMPPASVNGMSLNGAVHGGQQGIAGSHVYLYVAGTTGYSSAPTSLLNTADTGVSSDGSGNGYVTTGANGVWTITGDYTCPSASSLVYLLALGGNPGLGGGANNAALSLMAALGPCSGLSAATFVDINEISTVASVFALSPFANFSTQGIATSSTNIPGLTHAFATAGSLANYATGLARTTTPSGGIVPQTEINTIADILSICVNSNGTVGGCPSLFAAATPTGGTTPTTTLQAALNIARHPASNVATLFNLQPAQAPFLPVLPIVYNSFTGTYTGVPNDWSIAITYFSSVWDNPEGIAADSQGNIWLVSGSTVAKLDPLGNQLEAVTGGQLGANNYNQTLAIDLNDRALIDDNSYWVSLIDSLGNNTTLADPPPPFGGPVNIAGFGGIVVDASNNYWAGSAANNSSALVTFNTTSGTGINASYTGGGLVNPIGEAIDYSGNIWVTNSNSAFANPGTVSKFSSGGVSLAGTTGFSGGGLNGCAGIAIDPSGNAWVTNATTATLTQLSPTGTPSAASPYSGGGLHYPSAIAVDGDGNLWVSNFGGPDVSGFTSTGTPLSPTGFFNGLASGQSGQVTVDASGNVWLADWDGYVSGNSESGSITQMVGLAAPTVTPIAVALKNHTIGTRP